jgi:hypothetical protein
MRNITQFQKTGKKYSYCVAEYWARMDPVMAAFPGLSGNTAPYVQYRQSF